MSDETFFSRWSKRKLASTAGAKGATADAIPAKAGNESQIAPPPTPLPPVESLTPESDFTPFLREGVEEHLKRAALKTLFQDPRFNVMDGLDVYIDDYSKPDPLPEGWLEKMNQVARLGEWKDPQQEADKAALENAPNGTSDRDAGTDVSSDTAVDEAPAAGVKES